MDPALQTGSGVEKVKEQVKLTYNYITLVAFFSSNTHPIHIAKSMIIDYTSSYMLSFAWFTKRHMIQLLNTEGCVAEV